MNTESFKRKLTAILSADVEGYSRLMGEDEDATIRTLTRYRELMSTLIQKHRGRVVDSPGDNLLAEFGSVIDGVRCAVEIQEELRVRNAELAENRRMQFRIGINLGDVVEEGERIYGDGVNIAARVEGLAEGGGICISGTVYDSIKNKLSLSYESLGEHTVKNITEPVRVYRMRVGPEAEVQKEAGPKRRRWAVLAIVVAVILVIGAVAIWNFYLRRPSVEPASVDRMAYPLPDKPSIAVLPFDNLSGDPGQEYIADGISENIITTLSKVSRMFVIARNSTFTYKGKPVKVPQVAEELGVRYVLEGSVQKSGDRLRVTAQLIDAIKGHHLWSEKYDRKMRDFFDLQDEITRKIVTELQVEVGIGEAARLQAKSTDNFEAWTSVAKGIELHLKINKEDNIRARALFQAAIKLDPEYSNAWYWLAKSHDIEARFGWSESRDASLKLALEFAQKALALDDKIPGVHTTLGQIYQNQRQLEKATSEYEMAISLGPNFSPGYAFLAGTKIFKGEFEESITLMKKAMRLSPYYDTWYLTYLANAYFFLRRYEEAIAAFNQLLDRCRKGECPPHAALSGLAQVYAEIGRVEEARAFMTEALEINPKLSLDFYRRIYPFKDPAHLQRVLDALSKAGLPDKPPLSLPYKPSIAVLPFVNMSGDPEQEYFSDGITENIITALSKVPKLFVIARNSTFTYKGKPVKVQQVGRELGVQYVLEGSIQRAKDRLRITAQLIDATTGHHLWSERYDRELKDIFALQDDITMKIITAMQVKLTDGERARMHAKGTDNLDAYLKFLQGNEHFRRLNPDDHILARRYFEEAIALDPEFADPYGLMGQILLFEVLGGQSKSPQKSIQQAFKLAQKVRTLDESHPSGQLLLGMIHRINGEHEKAIAACERAVALNPNPTVGSLYILGDALSYAGRPQEAIPHFKRAIRLSPLDPSYGLSGLGIAYIMMERYEEAITALKKVLHYQPDSEIAHVRLAVCYAALGKEEEAHTESAEVLRLVPKFSVEKFSKRLTFRDKAVKARFFDELRKAGLPD